MRHLAIYPHSPRDWSLAGRCYLIRYYEGFLFFFRNIPVFLGLLASYATYACIIYPSLVAHFRNRLAICRAARPVLHVCFHRGGGDLSDGCDMGSWA